MKIQRTTEERAEQLNQLKMEFDDTSGMINKYLPEIQSKIDSAQQELSEYSRNISTAIQKISQHAREVKIEQHEPLTTYATKDYIVSWTPTKPIKRYISPQVMKIFNQGYELLLKPQVWEHVIVMPLTGMIKSYSK